MIEDARMKYISALDRNQIPTSGVNLTAFEDLDISETDKSPPRPPGFEKYDEMLYFKDAGIIEGKRYVLGFNPGLFAEDRKNREEKIALFRAS